VESASLAAVLRQPPQRLIAVHGRIGLGRFSDGIERLPDAEITLRLGSFADGYEQVACPSCRSRCER
jgi:hypothetical protein